MFQDKMVLCASSAYEKKFYLNENFEGLPQHVKDELKINVRVVHGRCRRCAVP